MSEDIYRRQKVYTKIIFSCAQCIKARTDILENYFPARTPRQTLQLCDTS